MNKKPLKIIAGKPDMPLMIGNIQIPCYVLEGEIRVLSQNGFLQAIGRTGRAATASKSDVFNPPPFLAQNNIKPFITNKLLMSSAPLLFQSPGAGKMSHGYRAEILPQVCEVYLKARDAGVLLPSQSHVAERCEVLIRGLAHVGIIALVDEATKYQKLRDKKALQGILDKYLRPYQARWAKRFPDDFYKEIFRLRGWQWQGMRLNPETKNKKSGCLLLLTERDLIDCWMMRYRPLRRNRFADLR